MNADLAKERQHASFNQNEMTNLLYGGAKEVERMRFLKTEAQKENDARQHKPIDFLTREQRYDLVAAKLPDFVKFARKHIKENTIHEIFLIKRAYYQRQELAPIELHLGMFLPTLENTLDEEQRKYWLPLAYSFGIIGTYAQTEMGHGTNLKCLETTATYDPSTEEFIMHSPTKTSAKFWPGNLGKSSTHALVMAQLHIKGKNYGPHPFIVQIRDLNSHEPLKGVTLRDIGPKFNMHSNDNGYMKLNHVRIPRRNMPMKYSQVLPDGTYVAPSHAKSNYSGMVFVRATMCSVFSESLAEACTIAGRYSVIRHQGQIDKSKPEVPLLDYQSQQYRILVPLAVAFAYRTTGSNMINMYIKMVANGQNVDMNLMLELHTLTSGLKATVSHDVCTGIEQCRLSCGGHGYALSSGLPQLYTIMVGGCTYEGDNIVMLLQAARQLVKAIHGMKTGKVTPTSTMKYLANKTSTHHTAALDPHGLVLANEHAARRLIYNCVESLTASVAGGQSFEQAWVDHQIQLTKAARAHTNLYVLRSFVEFNSHVRDHGCRQVLDRLCHLFACHITLKHLANFLEDGYLNQHQVEKLRSSQRELLAFLRPDAIPLVDSWDFSDWQLNSVLGRYDGQVYDGLINWIEQSDLNDHEVLPAHNKYLKNFMARQRLETAKL